MRYRPVVIKYSNGDEQNGVYLGTTNRCYVKEQTGEELRWVEVPRELIQSYRFNDQGVLVQ